MTDFIKLYNLSTKSWVKVPIKKVSISKTSNGRYRASATVSGYKLSTFISNENVKKITE
jgi:hypothetical protein